MTVLSAFLESLNVQFNKLKKYIKSFTTNIMAIQGIKTGRLYTKNRRTVEELQKR